MRSRARFSIYIHMILLAVAGLGAKAAAQASQTGVKSTADATAAYEHAREFERNGEAGKAIEEYNRAVTLNPRYLEAFEALGELCWKKNRYLEAEMALSSALKLNPEYEPAVKTLGQVLNRQGKYEQSVELYRRWLEGHPQSANERVHYAEALIGGRQMDAASEELGRALADEALEKSLRVEAHLQLGILLNREERNKAAAAQFEKALELDANSTLANLYLGVALYNLKKAPEAEIALLKALKLGGGDAATANLFLGQIYHDQRKYDLAIQAWETYLKANPNGANAESLRDAIKKLKAAVAKE
jgi:tetratricopeptide (TPR) repeat protein